MKRQLEPEEIVPAHAGGVDLSVTMAFTMNGHWVPAHAGGVDLSLAGSGAATS